MAQICNLALRKLTLGQLHSPLVLSQPPKYQIKMMEMFLIGMIVYQNIVKEDQYETPEAGHYS